MIVARKTCKCDNCGCISLPDAKFCPRCGMAYSSSDKLFLEHQELYRGNILKKIKKDLSEVLEHQHGIIVNLIFCTSSEHQQN
jgi:hypothetical protein